MNFFFSNIFEEFNLEKYSSNTKIEVENITIPPKILINISLIFPTVKLKININKIQLIVS